MIVMRVLASLIIVIAAALLAEVIGGHPLSKNGQELVILLGMLGWLAVVMATFRSRS